MWILACYDPRPDKKVTTVLCILLEKSQRTTSGSLAGGAERKGGKGLWITAIDSWVRGGRCDDMQNRRHFDPLWTHDGHARVDFAA
jgi:hypothetical protein